MGDLFDDCNTRGSEELVAEVVSFVVFGFAVAEEVDRLLGG